VCLWGWPHWAVGLLCALQPGSWVCCMCCGPSVCPVPCRFRYLVCMCACCVLLLLPQHSNWVRPQPAASARPQR
jgi:hypothetical protein